MTCFTVETTSVQRNLCSTGEVQWKLEKELLVPPSVNTG